jgi:hypothetical protein
MAEIYNINGAEFVALNDYKSLQNDLRGTEQALCESERELNNVKNELAYTKDYLQSLRVQVGTITPNERVFKRKYAELPVMFDNVLVEGKYPGIYVGRTEEGENKVFLFHTARVHKVPTRLIMKIK